MTESHKTGCRRKGCIIPLASITLILAIFVAREVYLALTATPGSAVNYHALADELVASYQPTEGENGWDFLIEAIDRKQAFEEHHEDEEYYGNGYLHLMMPADWDEDGASREALAAAGMEGLDGMREAGVWDVLDQLARSPRIVRTLPQRGVLLDVLLPELGRARALARALGARMWVSHDAGDDADVAAAFAQSCGISRALMHQFTLIDQLVGIAIFSLASEQLRYELALRPMDEPTLALVAGTLDQMTNLPAELPYQGERLFMLDTIQWMHTDDGHGNGRLIYSQLGGLQSFTGRGRTTGSPWANLASLAMPSKKQTTAQAERFYSAVIEAAQTPRNQRAALQLQPDAWVMQIPKRQILLQMLLPALGKALQTRDQFDAMLAGTRTMVALERFKLRDGIYPTTLDQLVPDFFETLPVDPFAKDGKFIYRTLDPALNDPPDLWNRPYTLYSVGLDETDDGGSADTEANTNAFRYDKSGTDFIFNLPRSEPAAESDSK